MCHIFFPMLFVVHFMLNIVCIIVLLYYCIIICCCCCRAMCSYIAQCIFCKLSCKWLLLNLCFVGSFRLCVISCSFRCDVYIVCCILYIYGVHCMLFISFGVLYYVKVRYALHFVFFFIFVIFKSFVS